MAAYKDKNTNTWYTSFYYMNWKDERKRKLKRGFATKREALEWEREFQQQQSADLDMTFESFIEIYVRDLKSRIKEYSWLTKHSVIKQKLLPIFGSKKMNEILPTDIIQWQNGLLNGNNGKKYSQTYLKAIHNQLNAIFNHAVKYYELKANPVKKAGSIGKLRGNEMKFWTKDEYLKFADSMKDTPLLHCAFEILYWCGLRVGELLALTLADLDFEKGTITINKSYQRIKCKDVITTPKTTKSNRTIKMPDFLIKEVQHYLKTIYGGIHLTERMFPVIRNYLRAEMIKGAKEQGLKHIRIHDLRHSHVSLLIEMGFSALAISDRLGHESIDMTYRYAHLFPSKQTEMADKLDLERTGG